MELHTEHIRIDSSERLDVQVITPQVEDAISELGMADGLVLVSTGHTTIAISTNEAEERLLQDMLEKFSELVPPNDWYFHDQVHLDTDTQPNAYGHILSAMVKRPVLLLLRAGDLDLGTYEEVLFFEFDGPRERTIDVTVLE